VTKQLALNQEKLKRAWEVSQRTTKDDWDEWMVQFSLELLRESPSPALRSCCTVAQVRACKRPSSVLLFVGGGDFARRPYFPSRTAITAAVMPSLTIA
jgi:hypothetical protein